MVENIGLGGYHGHQCFVVTFEIWDQDFDFCCRDFFPDRVYGFDKKKCSSVGKIISGNRCDHHIPKAHRGGSFGHSGGFVFLGRGRSPFFYSTKGTVAGACVSQDQESGCAVCPTFRNVRALGALTDGMYILFFDKIGDLEKILMRGEFDLEPRWLFFGL